MLPQGTHVIPQKKLANLVQTFGKLKLTYVLYIYIQMSEELYYKDKLLKPTIQRNCLT